MCLDIDKDLRNPIQLVFDALTTTKSLTAVPPDCPTARERAWFLAFSFADMICMFKCRDPVC